MWVVLRVICWELKYASRKDGDHQQKAALTAQTPPGVGRAGAVRERKARQPKTRRVQQKRKRQSSFSTPRRKWSELHEDLGDEADPWVGMGMYDAEAVLTKKNQAETPTVLGKTQRNDRRLAKNSQASWARTRRKTSA